MSEEKQPAQQEVKEEKRNDKEYNFAQLRKQLESEREDKKRLEQKVVALEERFRTTATEEDDHYDEPYVDEKRLNKKLTKFEQRLQSQFEAAASQKAQELLEKERQNSFLKANPDFYDVLNAENLQKFAEKHPEVAEDFVEIPDTFARQKLLYRSLKAFKEPPKDEKTIQQIVDEKRRSPYYQPSGIANPPHSAAGDFSVPGQQSAYKKMQELKSKLRL